MLLTGKVGGTEMTLVLANQFRESNRLDEAIAAYQTLIDSQPTNASIYDLLGQTQAQKGNLDEAIISYQKAIELGLEQSFWTYKNLGDALGAKARLGEAISAYQKAIKLDNRNPYVYDSLAQIQARQSDFDLAIDNYRHVSIVPASASQTRNFSG